jgi:CheY-like chemotaxis protein
VVYGIVQQHGGTIQVAETSPAGTTLAMTLPAASESARSDPRPALRRAAQGGSATILLVDDEPLVLGAISVALRALGYEVIEACNGSDALAILERQKGEVDAVILDMIMPGLAGVELLSAMRSAAPAIPVIVTGGRIEESEEADARARGAAAILHKPYDLSRLSEELRRILA